MTGRPERLLIVGLGSIGRRHLAVARGLAPEMEVMALRRAGSESDGLAVVTSLDEALDARPDAVIVANPAALHVATAQAFVKAGKHVLIEKPLSNRLDGIDELLELSHERGTVLQVGYCLRFHPSLIAMKKAVTEGRIGRVLSLRAEAGHYLPDWRPGADYRDGVSARRDLGGGALFELSHEIDLARWLVGEVVSVTSRCGRLSRLEIDTEDYADLLFDFASGACANVHLDMAQRNASRSCTLTGEDGTLHWDGVTYETRLFGAEAGAWEVLCEGNPDPDIMYREQLRHFLDCISKGGAPSVTGGDGKRAVEIVLAAKHSSQAGRSIPL